MLIKLKHILQTYTDKELEDMDLWVNSNDTVTDILIDKYNIDLITDGTEIRVNGAVTHE